MLTGLLKGTNITEIPFPKEESLKCFILFHFLPNKKKKEKKKKKICMIQNMNCRNLYVVKISGLFDNLILWHSKRIYI